MLVCNFGSTSFAILAMVLWNLSCEMTDHIDVFLGSSGQRKRASTRNWVCNFFTFILYSNSKIICFKFKNYLLCVTQNSPIAPQANERQLLRHQIVIRLWVESIAWFDFNSVQLKKSRNLSLAWRNSWNWIEFRRSTNNEQNWSKLLEPLWDELFRKD